MKKLVIAILIATVLLGIFYLFYSDKLNLSSFDFRKVTTLTNDSAQSHRSYKMEIISKPTAIEPNSKITIVYEIKNDKGETLKNYDTVHEKIMHFIVVRKDLAYFQHLHPDFDKSTGEFKVAINFPEDGSYRVFPDFTPGDDNPQKLPVTVYQDLDVGNLSNYYAQTVAPDTEKSKTYGDYEVNTTITQGENQSEVTYSLNIAKDDEPVTDLENYLGALGHSVILKEGSLDFIHTHALDASSVGQEHGSMQHGGSPMPAGKGPVISFATTFPGPGVYKIFTQFQHQKEIQTVDYTINVK